MISQRKQGISTDQLGKGKTGFVKFIEVTLKISTFNTDYILTKAENYQRAAQQKHINLKMMNMTT